MDAMGLFAALQENGFDDLHELDAHEALAGIRVGL
jgi:hypothetical protein